MDAANAIRQARSRARLTQQELARRSGTSQATLSAYESGRKQPSAATLTRILAAAGQRMSIEPADSAVVQVTDKELADRGRRLLRLLEFAELMPSDPGPNLRYPPLRQQAR